MQWGASAVRSAWSEATHRELPCPWPTLGRHVRPGAGQQVMLVADPGVGKTAFAVNWATRSGARTLYCSPDTDPELMTLQLASLATGHERSVAEERLKTSNSWRALYSQAIQERFPNFVLDSSSAPSVESIGEQAEALTELWGETPQLIVIDTASDIAKRGRDWEAWEETWQDCRVLARFFKSVVMLAHHKNGHGQGSMNADRFAEMVLDLRKSNGDEITAEVIKNRGGKAHFQVHFAADFPHARIEER